MACRSRSCLLIFRLLNLLLLNLLFLWYLREPLYRLDRL